MEVKRTSWGEAAGLLLAGEAGVLPTDTLYGIVGSALQPAVVERIYALRQRERDKPLIVLLGDMSDFERLHIVLDGHVRLLLSKVWPGPVSVIVPAVTPELAYLHRGSGGIAFRMPAKAELRELLRQTGPVVAPSANLAGQPPALTVDEGYAYFGDHVFYVDGGRVEGAPSALVDIRGGQPKILRPAPGFDIELLD